jgi:predicted metal-dependent peptidase
MNQRMDISIGRIVTREPFYASVILGLEIVEAPGLDTFGTDGRRLLFDPGFLKELDDDELNFVNLHETEHVARLHSWRRFDRDWDTWNRACDYLINWWLKKAGYKMPKDGLCDARFADMCEEQIYAILWTEQGSKPKDQPGQQPGQPGQPGNQPGQSGQQPGQKPGNKQGQGKGKAQPGALPKWGHVHDCPGTESEKEAAKQESIVNVLRAAKIAKQQGKLPGHFSNLVEEILHPKVSWQEHLRNYLSAIAQDDYSWLRPNMRYIASGFYIPSLRNERCGTIAVVIDTSGSIGSEEFAQFMGELREIISAMKPETLIVCQCDAEIPEGGWRVFTDGEELPQDFAMVGGGGTSFLPPFKRIEEEDIRPDVLVYLTDGYGDFPKHAPDYPVLWTMTTDVNAPWGDVIRIEDSNN